MRYWWWILAVLALLGWTYLAYDLGRQQAGYHSLEALKKQVRLKEEISALVDERDALQLEVEQHERSRRIDQDASRMVQDEVKSLQNDKAGLKREIAFLRELVSAGNRDLQVRDFRIEAIDQARFRYRLTVVQAVDNVDVVRGKLKFSVTGLLAGQARTFGLAELSPATKGTRKLRFKNFQDVVGELKLPAEFKPSTVTVEIIPEGRKLKALQHIVDWRLSPPKKG